MLKLYYAAGGCSISPHIALREVGALGLALVARPSVKAALLAEGLQP